MPYRRRLVASDLVDALESAKLRSIGPRVGSLTPREADAVSKEVLRRLGSVVGRGALSHGHRGLITALQFLAPPAAGDVLIGALRQAIHLTGCCGCTHNRTMRALGTVRPLDAIPALVDTICDVPDPGHKQLAAVCIEKIVRARGEPGQRALERESDRLRRELRRLQAAVANQRPVTPAKPWVSVPGSPKWFAAAERARRAMARLVESRGGADVA